MVDYKVVGVKRVDFDGKDGKVKGVKVYAEAEDEKVDGVMTDAFWFGADKFPDVQGVKLEEYFNVYYNRYGKVDSVCFVG